MIAIDRPRSIVAWRRLFLGVAIVSLHRGRGSTAVVDAGVLCGSTHSESRTEVMRHDCPCSLAACDALRLAALARVGIMWACTTASIGNRDEMPLSSQAL